MLRTLFIVVSMLGFGLAHGQKPLHKTYDWENTPKIHEITEAERMFPAVVVSQNRFSEIVTFGMTADNFYTEHKILHVNSDAGVERYNKVYLPFSGGRELVDLKVRAIDPSGKVTSFRKENLKELKNVDGYRNYKIFAIEGVSVGGEIEYLYTVKSAPELFGREVMQAEIPVKSSTFVLIYPAQAHFVSKSYNGLADATWSDYGHRRSSLKLHATDIPALAEELYSSHNASLMRLDYKMPSNGDVNSLFTWTNISEHILKQIGEEKIGSKVEKIVKSLKVDNLSEEQKVQVLERYIKTYFTIKDGSNPAYVDLESIVSTHVANEEGIVKIYVACLFRMGIVNTLVYSCPRNKGKVDPDFSTRLGAAPDELGGNNGLFIAYRIRSNGQLEYLKHDVSPIALRRYIENGQGMNATIKLKNSLAEVTQENFWQGSGASMFRGIYSRIDNAHRDEFMEAITISDVHDYSLVSREVVGEDINLNQEPSIFFRIKSNYQAESLVERAGDDYLVAIGKIIGKQSELYHDRQRITEIDFPYPLIVTMS